MKTVLLTLALATALRATGHWGVEEDGDVAVLTVDNFDDFIKNNEKVFVKFYAPWCGHCKSMAPGYTELAQDMKKVEGDEHVAIAKVDATVHNELATRFSVQGFPTLKLFINGNPIDYSSGSRDKDALASWLKKKSGPSSSLISTAEELATAQGNNLSVMMLLPEGEEDSLKAFFGVAAGYEAVPFYHTHDAALVADAGLTETYSMAIFRGFDDGHKFLTGSSMLSAENMKTFIESHRFPIVMEFEQEAAERIFGAEASAFFYFDEDFESEGVAGFREFAKANRGKVIFSISKVSSGLGARLAEFVGVTAADAPTARVVKFENQNLKKYVVSDLSSDGMTSALESFLAGSLEEYYKSEAIPETNDEPVKVIVGNSFEELVLKSEAHVLFEAYAPWCGHCKKLAPIFEELATKVADKEDIVIAKMDATGNEYPGLEIRGFPTLIFYKKGEKSTPVPYEGERTLDGMLEFLEKQTGYTLREGGVDGEL